MQNGTPKAAADCSECTKICVRPILNKTSRQGKADTEPTPFARYFVI